MAANRTGPVTETLTRADLRQPALTELPVNPAELGPYSDALNAQVELIDYWLRVSQRIPPVQELAGLLSNSPQPSARLAEVMSLMLGDAETLYVHDRIVDWIIAPSLDSVSPKQVLRCSSLPTQSGFLYLAKPIEMACHAPEYHVERLPRGYEPREIQTKGPTLFEPDLHTANYHRLRVVAWQYLPPGPPRQSESKRIILEDAINDALAARGEQPGRLVRSDRPALLIQTYVDQDDRAGGLLACNLAVRDVSMWHDGETIDATTEKGDYLPSTWESAPNARDGGVTLPYARRLIVAVSAFMRQRLHQETPRSPNGAARRRYAGTKYVEKTIRVVHMRRFGASESYSPSEPGEGRKITGLHWLVRPHPRWQWYRSLGPASDPAAHETIFIEMYDKGDKSLPIRPNRRLFAVVR